MAQGGRMKGYIAVFTAILLLYSMVLFSGFYADNVNSRNLAATKTNQYSKLEFVKDDLGFDLNRILGTSIQVKNSADNLEITFREKVPADFDKTKRINKFKEFVETSYSSINNAKIKLNTKKLKEKIPIKFSNNLVYEYNLNKGKNSVVFYALNGDTNILWMDLNLNVQGNATWISRPVPVLNPDVVVNFNYVDENALNERHEVRLIDSSIDNKITIRFSDNAKDTIEIHLGSFDGKKNAVKVLNQTFNQEKALLSFKAVMPSIDFNAGLKAFVDDLTLEYKQTGLKSNSLIEIRQLS
jgi:hypothetical protein